MLASYEKAKGIAARYQCPDCLGTRRLIHRHNNAAKSDEVVCPCGRTEGFIKRKGVTQIWRENPETVPIEVANKLANKHHEEIEAVADGLPPELAEVVRERYFGLPIQGMPTVERGAKRERESS